jgi:DeoR family fructose operon transcriptional repressor
VYAEERQQAIAARVARERRLAVSDAAEAFGVTTETVRRDLAVLERQGLVRRVHGGAVPVDALTTLERAVDERDEEAAAEKERIAKAALDLLPGTRGSVILDAGTTTARLAAQLPADTRLTVVTNSAPIASRLGRLPHLDLQLLGGRVRSASQAAVGPSTLSALSELRVDVSFLGANGLSLAHGLSTPDVDEAAVKSAMVAAGRRVVVLADSRKIGAESLVRFGSLTDLDTVVTDAGISDSDARALEALDIDVVIA